MAEILVVGAGAVGQVFARHLQLAGAEVTFFVREKHRAEVEEGLPVYSHRRKRGSPPALVRARAMTTAGEVARRKFDQVYLAVPSPAVREPWLRELSAVLGEATVVSLQATAEDREAVLAAGVPADRLVSGLISFIAWQAPLPGEEGRYPTPGVAYWHPPMSPSPFSGPADRVAEVVALLRKGGCPAKRHPDVPGTVAFTTAILMAYLAALEVARWSFDAFFAQGYARRGARAASEAVEIMAHQLGRRPWWSPLAGWWFLMRAVVWLGKRVAPFPFEVYFQKHFTKVGEQTGLILRELLLSPVPAPELKKLAEERARR
jgi:ketopantoate reductase